MTGFEKATTYIEWVKEKLAGSLPARELYGQLELLEDGKPKTFNFISKQSAQAFVDFCHLYIAESGAGNGYGAYWPYVNQQVRGLLFTCHGPQIQSEIVNEMLASIVRARLATIEPLETVPQGVELRYYTGINDFTFYPEKIPKRSEPRVGDLAIVVDLDSPHERKLMRVRSIEGTTAHVIQEPIDNRDTFEGAIPLAHLMKYRDIYLYYKSDQSVEERLARRAQTK